MFRNYPSRFRPGMRRAARPRRTRAAPRWKRSWRWALEHVLISKTTCMREGELPSMRRFQGEYSKVIAGDDSPRRRRELLTP